MFYSSQILARKGPLGIVWIAAHVDGQLKRNQVFELSIPGTVEALLSPEVPLALRLTGQLLLGVVRVFARKVAYLHQDCNDAIVKINIAFRHSCLELAPDGAIAPDTAIMLPDDAFDDVADVIHGTADGTPYEALEGYVGFGGSAASQSQRADGGGARPSNSGASGMLEVQIDFLGGSAALSQRSGRPRASALGGRELLASAFAERRTLSRMEMPGDELFEAVPGDDIAYDLSQVEVEQLRAASASEARGPGNVLAGLLGSQSVSHGGGGGGAGGSTAERSGAAKSGGAGGSSPGNTGAGGGLVRQLHHSPTAAGRTSHDGSIGAAGDGTPGASGGMHAGASGPAGAAPMTAWAMRRAGAAEHGDGGGGVLGDSGGLGSAVREHSGGGGDGLAGIEFDLGPSAAPSPDAAHASADGQAGGAPAGGEQRIGGGGQMDVATAAQKAAAGAGGCTLTPLSMSPAMPLPAAAGALVGGKELAPANGGSHGAGPGAGPHAVRSSAALLSRTVAPVVDAGGRSASLLKTTDVRAQLSQTASLLRPRGGNAAAGGSRGALGMSTRLSMRTSGGDARAHDGLSRELSSPGCGAAALLAAAAGGGGAALAAAAAATPSDAHLVASPLPQAARAVAPGSGTPQLRTRGASGSGWFAGGPASSSGGSSGNGTPSAAPAHVSGSLGGGVAARQGGADANGGSKDAMDVDVAEASPGGGASSGAENRPPVAAANGQAPIEEGSARKRIRMEDGRAADMGTTPLALLEGSGSGVQRTPLGELHPSGLRAVAVATHAQQTSGASGGGLGLGSVARRAARLGALDDELLSPLVLEWELPSQVPRPATALPGTAGGSGAGAAPDRRLGTSSSGADAGAAAAASPLGRSTPLLLTPLASLEGSVSNGGRSSSSAALTAAADGALSAVACAALSALPGDAAAAALRSITQQLGSQRGSAADAAAASVQLMGTQLETSQLLLTQSVVSMCALTQRSSRIGAARAFSELLLLQSRGMVAMSQTRAYGDVGVNLTASGVMAASPALASSQAAAALAVLQP